MAARPDWIQVFLDTPAPDYEEAVAFWSAVTGWAPSKRRGEEGQFLTLLPAAGAAYVNVRAVDGPAGVHLDLDSADRPAAVARARELGATSARPPGRKGGGTSPPGPEGGGTSQLRRPGPRHLPPPTPAMARESLGDSPARCRTHDPRHARDGP